MSEKKRQPELIAYCVTMAGEQSYFHRIGVAWNNSKGGCNIKLDAFPVNGELVLLPPKDRSEQ